MKLSTATRVILLIFGILLILLSIALFAMPGMNTVVLGYIACILMLVYGIAQIVFYCINHKTQAVSGWVLADGILTGILGLLLLFMPGVQILTMSFLFAMWVLFGGITRLAGSFAVKDAGSSDWGWILAAGIIGTLLGIWLMFDPMLSLMTIGILVPLAFLFQGISAIATFFSTKSLKAE